MSSARANSAACCIGGRSSARLPVRKPSHSEACSAEISCWAYLQYGIAIMPGRREQVTGNKCVLEGGSERGGSGRRGRQERRLELWTPNAHATFKSSDIALRHNKRPSVRPTIAQACHFSRLIRHERVDRSFHQRPENHAPSSIVSCAGAARVREQRFL